MLLGTEAESKRFKVCRKLLWQSLVLDFDIGEQHKPDSVMIAAYFCPDTPFPTST